MEELIQTIRSLLSARKRFHTEYDHHEALYTIELLEKVISDSIAVQEPEQKKLFNLKRVNLNTGEEMYCTDTRYIPSVSTYLGLEILEPSRFIMMDIKFFTKNKDLAKRLDEYEIQLAFNFLNNRNTRVNTNQRLIVQLGSNLFEYTKELVEV